MFIQLAIDLDILQQGVKQWGQAAATSGIHVNFPISFTTIFGIVNVIIHSGIPVYANTVFDVNINSSGLGASTGGNGRYWIAWGKA